MATSLRRSSFFGGVDFTLVISCTMDEQSKSLSIGSERMNSLTQQPQQKLNGSNSKASAAELSSSRRVSMDSMISNLGGNGNPPQSTNRDSTPHMVATTPLRRGSSGSERVTIDDCSPSNPSGGGAASSSSLVQIPPVGRGFVPQMAYARRASAPGFFSRQNPLPPFVPSPHLPGMNFLPFPSMPPFTVRRSSFAGGFMNHNNMHFPPGRMISSMDVFPGPLPFPNAGPSMMMGGGGGRRNDSTPSPSMDGSGRGEEMMGGSSRSSRRGSLDSSSDKAAQTRSRPTGGVSSFPVKLHRILSDNDYSDYLAWLPHGRAWRILKQKSFEKEVIPKYFRSARYASFMRQVRSWQVLLR